MTGALALRAKYLLEELRLLREAMQRSLENFDRLIAGAEHTARALSDLVDRYPPSGEQPRAPPTSPPCSAVAARCRRGRSRRRSAPISRASPI